MTIAPQATERHAMKLSEPAAAAGQDLMQALRLRRSTRALSARPLPEHLLSTLLWAACGINRHATGGRTAPSAHGWREIEVYAALADGLYRYDAAGHALQPVAPGDVRALTGTQDFVASVPLDLVYVADFSRMTGASEQDRTFFAATDAAVIAQNVYLLCAAKGLGTVVRGLVDRQRLAPVMGLRREQRIVLAQSVGFPAD